MSGTFKVDSSGKVEFQEEDGIDYAPVTVQLPGGERVPFLNDRACVGNTTALDLQVCQSLELIVCESVGRLQRTSHLFAVPPRQRTL